MDKSQQKILQVIAGLAIAVSLSAIFAICLHSVEEIHYLKSFFPRKFSVQEAFYASGVELVKIIVLLIPLLTIIGVALFILRNQSGKQ